MRLCETSLHDTDGSTAAQCGRLPLLREQQQALAAHVCYFGQRIEGLSASVVASGPLLREAAVVAVQALQCLPGFCRIVPCRCLNSCQQSASLSPSACYLLLKVRHRLETLAAAPPMRRRTARPLLLWLTCCIMCCGWTGDLCSCLRRLRHWKHSRRSRRSRCIFRSVFCN